MPDPQEIVAPAVGAPPPPDARLEFQAYFDCDPEVFPAGAEFMVMRPGELQPLGRLIIPKGCMLFIVAPEPAQHIRPELRKMLRQLRDQQARALADRG